MATENKRFGSVASMTERYSFGHKVVSVALSVVLLGFGWPTSSLAKANDADAVESDVSAQVVEQDDASQASDIVSDAASDDTADSAAAANESQTAADVQDGSSSATAEQADVQLDLKEASIVYLGQVVAYPTAKVTVSTKADFQFTALPNSGSKVEKVILTVDGQESTLSADAEGVYTVTAADVAAGASVKLVAAEDENDTAKGSKAVSLTGSDNAEANISVANDTNDSSNNENLINSVALTDDEGESYTKPDDTDTDKYLYVGESASYTGSGYYASSHNWAISDKSVATVASSSSNSVTVTGKTVGSATLTHKYGGWWSSSSETFTIHVVEAAPITELTISGADSVEQFKNTTLTTNVAGVYDVTWTSSDPSVATIDASGKVVGVKEGSVTITATTVTDEGAVLTATHDMTVAESSATATDAYLFFQNSPTANPDSNTGSAWFPSGSAHSLAIKLNLEGASWTGQNSYSNVSNRVMSWPDGSTGTSWELDKTNSAYSTYWYAVYNAWKDTLEKE